MRIVIDYNKAKGKTKKKSIIASIVEIFLSYHLAGNYYGESFDSIFVEFIENPKPTKKFKRRILYGNIAEIEVLQTFTYTDNVTVLEFKKIFDAFMDALVYLDEIKLEDFNNKEFFKDLKMLEDKFPINEKELVEIRKKSKEIESKIYTSRNNNAAFDKRQQAKQIPFRELVLSQNELVPTNRKKTLPISIQGDFMTRYIRNEARKLKFKGQYHTVTITLNDNYKIKKGTEGLTILVPFDLEKYKEVYPNFEVDLPLKKTIPNDNEQEVNNFLSKLIIDALKYAKSENIYLPIDELIEIIEKFRESNYKFEWYHKSRLFKDLGVKARLHCKLTNHNFSLDFVLMKGNKEVFRKKIHQSHPWHEGWRNYYEDIILEDNHLVVTRQYAGKSIFKISSKEILEIVAKP